MNKLFKVILLLILIGAIGFVYMKYKTPTSNIEGDTNYPITNPLENPENAIPKDNITKEGPLEGSGGYACTMDAMMCPDGSYVGRTGPKCEFKCPDSSAGGTVLAGTPHHALGESLEYDGITIIPLRVKEDSRCKEGVQCIWAGRLVVTTRLENTMGASSGSGVPGPAVKKFFEEVDLEMGKPYSFANKTITLKDEKDFKFTFEVK